MSLRNIDRLINDDLLKWFFLVNTNFLIDKGGVMTTDVKHNQQATFVLKLTGINLENLNPVDIGKLLQDFCYLIGDKNLRYEGVYQGSAVIKLTTDTNLYTQKLDILNKNISKSSPAFNDINKIIRGYSANFPNIEGKILACPTACNDDDFKVIYEFDYRELPKRQFEQAETLIGKLLKPAHGKDATDHFTIQLANDKTASVELSKALSFELASHLESLWKFDTLIAFTGQARYEKQGYTLKLLSFKANGFEIVDNQQDAKIWADEMISFGKSGWQSLDNPLQTWLAERHV